MRQYVAVEDFGLRVSPADRSDVLEKEHDAVATRLFPGTKIFGTLFSRSLAADQREQSFTIELLSRDAHKKLFEFVFAVVGYAPRHRRYANLVEITADITAMLFEDLDGIGEFEIGRASCRERV